jgi:hypothetical protein
MGDRLMPVPARKRNAQGSRGLSRIARAQRSIAVSALPTHACTFPPIPQATAVLGLSAAARSSGGTAASAPSLKNHNA